MKQQNVGAVHTHTTNTYRIENKETKLTKKLAVNLLYKNVLNKDGIFI